MGNQVEDAGAYLPTLEEIDRLKKKIRAKNEAQLRKKYEPRQTKQKSFGVSRKARG